MGKSTHVFFGLVVAAAPLYLSAEEWQTVSDDAELRALFSDKIFTATLKGNVQATATYNADGTGVLNAWNDSFPRRWSVADGKICVEVASDSHCVSVERSLDNPNKLRGTRTDTGEAVEFTFEDNKAVVSTQNATGAGGTATPSAEELALKLSNPTSPVMTIGNNIDYIAFDGDLDSASSQSAIRYSFQTVFPFKLPDGKGSVFFRPTIPVIFNDPVPGASGSYDKVGTELGDMGFDFSYGQTTKTGLIYGGGMVGTIPTGTDDRITKNKWAAGPELLIGKIGKWGATIGLFTHQWDFAGSGDAKINQSTFNYIYAFQLGGGWQFAAAPVITYDHTRPSNDALSLPLGVGIAKTTVLAGRPWKFQVQYWNYVENSSAFSAKHQVRLSINPVVSAPWNEGK
ncbi:hypothetical protein [Agarivorans sp. JK6]|uniref:hypothetical protein n=1 Tax=Agarivorans sp. JK6 TaxID=2997426 RepID=UPI0038735E88